MESGVFRKASVERVNSPEQLNHYIKVTRVSVWFILALIALFLSAMIVLGCVGTVETTVTVGTVAKHDDVDNGVWCYANRENALKLKEGMTIRVNGIEGTIGSVPSLPIEVTGDDLAGFAAYCAGDENDPYVYEIEVYIDGLEDGVYSAEVITDEVRPIEFIIGGSD